MSPKSGRAVSASAGEPYKDRLLPLPQFLLAGRQAQVTAEDVVRGLALTGHFLKHASCGRAARRCRRCGTVWQVCLSARSGVLPLLDLLERFDFHLETARLVRLQHINEPVARLVMHGEGLARPTFSKATSLGMQEVCVTANDGMTSCVSPPKE